ncbi:hypothetical protein P3S67_027847 [Capsicum chacoense]
MGKYQDHCLLKMLRSFLILLMHFLFDCDGLTLYACDHRYIMWGWEDYCNERRKLTLGDICLNLDEKELKAEKCVPLNYYTLGCGLCVSMFCCDRP